MSPFAKPGATSPDDFASRVVEALTPRIERIIRDSKPPQGVHRIKDVAALLSTSERSVWGMIEAGELPVIYISARQPRIHADVVDAFLRRKARQSGNGGYQR